MTMQMIRTTKQHAELADAHKDFIQLARYAMLAKGKTLDARAHAEAEGASRVQRILTKAEPGLVSAPGGSPETWAARLTTTPGRSRVRGLVAQRRGLRPHAGGHDSGAASHKGCGQFDRHRCHGNRRSRSEDGFRFRP